VIVSEDVTIVNLMIWECCWCYCESPFI